MVKFGRKHRGAMPVFSCKGFSRKTLLKMHIEDSGQPLNRVHFARHLQRGKTQAFEKE